MSILDTFYILFESDASKLDKGLAESEKKAQHTAEKIGEVDKTAAKLGGTLQELALKSAAFLGVGVGFAALVAGIKLTAEENVALEKLAAKLGSTTDAVDEFLDSAELLGVGSQVGEDGLNALSKAAEDAALGMGRSKKVFEELGVAVTDANGKTRPIVDLMGDLSGKLATLDKGRQLRIMERLGLNPALLRVFTADVADLQSRMARIDAATGFSLDRAVKQSKEFVKAQKEMGLETNTLKMLVSKWFESLNVNAMEVATKALKYATEALRGFTNWILDHRRLVEGALIAIGSVIAYFVVPAALSGAAAVWAMIAPFVAVGAAVAALIAVFALLYDDIVAFNEGQDSLIGRMVARWPVLGDIFRGVKAAWRYMVDGMTDNIERVVDAWNVLIEVVREVIGLFGKAWDLGAKVGEWFSNKFGSTGIVEAKQQLALASSSPISSVTSNSIMNANRNSNRNVTVQTGPVTVQTQATDAEGTAKAFGGVMGSQIRQAINHFDDGVAY